MFRSGGPPEPESAAFNSQFRFGEAEALRIGARLYLPSSGIGMHHLPCISITGDSVIGEQVPGLYSFFAWPADDERQGVFLIAFMQARHPQQTSFDIAPLVHIPFLLGRSSFHAYRKAIGFLKHSFFIH